MNTASDPKTTALLMTTSISYRRDLRVAIASAVHTNKGARRLMIDMSGELVHTGRRNVTATTTAAVANHFICSRSSSLDRRYRRIVEISAATSPIGMNSAA